MFNILRDLFYLYKLLPNNIVSSMFYLNFVFPSYSTFFNSTIVMMYLDTNIFLFLLSIFLNFIFLFFLLMMKRHVTNTLLFLLPPSCMVVPIGELANKLSFSSTTFSISNMASSFKTALPTISTEKDIGMDIQMG